MSPDYATVLLPDSIAIGGGSGLRLSIADAFAPLEQAWRQLEQENYCYAFQSYDWIASWHRHVGATSGISPCLLLLTTNDGEPLCILPFGIERRHGVRCLIWLGGKLADYKGGLFSARAIIATEPGQWLSLWNRLRCELPAHDVIILERQGATLNGLKNPFVLPGSFAHACDAHSTKLYGNLDTFLRSKRSGKWLRQQRRKERKLAEYGEIRFVASSNAEDIATLMPVMLEQKRRSYRALGVADLFENKANVDFVNDLTTTHFDRQFVVLFGLCVGDEVAATIWGLSYRGRFYHLLPTYSKDELANWSPGNVLLHKVFDWCLNHGIDTYDFTAGDEDYKMKWCDQHLKLYDCIEGVTVSGRLYAGAQVLQRRTKARIKKSPFLFSLFRRVRSLRSLIARP